MHQTITIHATGEQVRAEVIDAGFGSTHNGDGKYRLRYARDYGGNLYRFTPRQRWAVCRTTLVRQRAERAFARN